MPNVVEGFRLYPRGFLGAIPAPRIEPIPDPDPDAIRKLLSHQFHVNKFRSNDEVTQANADVETLYADYIRQTPGGSRFNFRTKVNQVALRAFGTSDFLFWMREQKRSLAYSDLHRRFLHDILRHLEGQPGELQMHTWDSLLRIDSSAVLSDSYPDRFIDEWAKRNRHIQTVTDAVQAWCSHQGGHENMLVTLHLLFGDF